jgi:N-acetylmuramoyl-L-alanine amidase
VVAAVLMDLARLDTAPRSRALAEALVGGVRAAGLRLHARPVGEAGFTVLRAADIPSVLFEIGFMSDADDLRNILDPDWRAQMQTALAAAILDWADADLARMALARQ